MSSLPGSNPRLSLFRSATKIPVIFTGVSDASEIGAAREFNRPEHNFTGPITINRELMPKRLELLKLGLPKLSHVGYLANPQYGLHEPQLKEMESRRTAAWAEVYSRSGSGRRST